VRARLAAESVASPGQAIGLAPRGRRGDRGPSGTQKHREAVGHADAEVNRQRAGGKRQAVEPGFATVDAVEPARPSGAVIAVSPFPLVRAARPQPRWRIRLAGSQIPALCRQMICRASRRAKSLSNHLRSPECLMRKLPCGAFLGGQRGCASPIWLAMRANFSICLWSRNVSGRLEMSRRRPARGDDQRNARATPPPHPSAPAAPATSGRITKRGRGPNASAANIFVRSSGL